MKKIILVLFLCLLINITYPNKVLGLNINSTSAILIEASTNTILYEKNPYEERHMASTTKIMTAILGIEHGNLDSIVNITNESAGVEGSSLYLRENEKLTLEDLLHGLMLVSGNDAAVAIAIHIGGSEENFIKMMNDKAKELGCNNTNFETPHGLPNDKHYTTAYDLAIIASYAMKNDTFVKIINAPMKSMPYENNVDERIIYNKNQLLNSYEGANGIKTGFTNNAGKCFVSAANQDGMQLIGVVLNSGDIYGESKSLLDYGFNNFEMEKIVEKGQYIKTYSNGSGEIVKLLCDEDIYYPTNITKQNNNLKIEFSHPFNITSNNSENPSTLTIKDDDKTVYTKEIKTLTQTEKTTKNLRLYFKYLTEIEIF